VNTGSQRTATSMVCHKAKFASVLSIMTVWRPCRTRKIGISGGHFAAIGFFRSNSLAIGCQSRE
jgi:hypothetical protein